jgi:hypothetical protein
MEKFGSVEGRTFVSRAVLRTIEAGTNETCTLCDDAIMFNAKKKPKMVIANVYEDGIWQNTELYHQECYEAVDEPYGRAFSGAPLLTLEERSDLAQAVGQ